MRNIVRCCFLILFLVHGFICGKYILENYNNKNLAQKLKESYHSNKNILEPENKVKKKSCEMLKRNSDFIGWINILNTNIDYPVVKTNNNSFYLQKDFLKYENHSGCIFVDCLNKVTDDIINGDKNIVFYGHNMKNGTMFSALVKFEDINFFNSNKHICFTTKSKEFEFEVFSVYVDKASNNYRKNMFSNDEEYMSFLKELRNKSMYKKDIELNKDDNIITLTTCSYEFDDARLIVHAKLVH